jgi:hypothetical protein
MLMVYTTAGRLPGTAVDEGIVKDQKPDGLRKEAHNLRAIRTPSATQDYLLFRSHL